MPEAPLGTAAPPRAPRIAPFRKLRMADAWFTTSAEACATKSFRTATAQSPSGASVDGASDALETFDLRKVRRELQEDEGAPVYADRRKVGRICVARDAVLESALLPRSTHRRSVAQEKTRRSADLELTWIAKAALAKIAKDMFCFLSPDPQSP